MSDLPIVQYWHDKAPPDYITALLDTFRANNPGVRHLVFCESSAEDLIAEHFSPREVRAFRACAIPAMQADYFRYCAAFAMGGLYCDADVRCVASLEAATPRRRKGRLFLRPHGAVVNGLFAFGSPGHPLLELTLEMATSNIEHQRWDQVYMTTGPALWTALYWLHRSGSFDASIESVVGFQRKEYVHSCCELIGDYVRVVRAFGGITVEPALQAESFVQFHGMQFPYKETDMHWANVKTGIYRDPLRRGS
jgi:hypothetical protein